MLLNNIIMIFLFTSVYILFYFFFFIKTSETPILLEIGKSTSFDISTHFIYLYSYNTFSTKYISIKTLPANSNNPARIYFSQEQENPSSSNCARESKFIGTNECIFQFHLQVQTKIYILVFSVNITVTSQLKLKVIQRNI